MSGTAPTDSAPGGHPSNRGVEQTPLDGNQHGQAQNIIDENKDTSGGIVDRDLGQNIDAGKGQKGLTSRVDDILNQPDTTNPETEKKGAARQQEGFKVGAEGDMHDLAQSKQP